MRIARLALASTALAACSDVAPLALPDGCNPLLAGRDCLLPYPSDFFRDPATGLIETRGAAKLIGKDGLDADVASWRPIHGYSRVNTIVTLFGAAVSTEKLVGLFDDPARSLSLDSSATLLVDAATLQPVAHFVDLDARAADDEHRALVIHPLAPLGESARYIVAVAGLEGTGGVLPAPEGFRRIRDGELAADEATLGALGRRYETDVFAPLASLGIARGSLQLAWDFTTGPDEAVTRDMFRARDLAISEVARTPPAVEVFAVEESADPGAAVWRIVRGRVTGPLVLTTARPGEGASLARDEAGDVRLNGTITFGFVALIPGAVRDAVEPGRVLAYGHGFFGGAREIEDPAPIAIANRLRAVLFAIDWWGMAREDSLTVADAIVGAPAETLQFSDGVHQAMVNWIAMSEAIPGALAELDAFERPNGERTYDPATAYNFIGLSQGHILGGVAAAIVPRFTRVALNVGGAAFTHLMFRARPFLPFLELFEYSIGDPLEMRKLVATMQRHFDRIDPATYAPYVGDRRVLLQIGVGDTQVPNVGSYLHARALGAGLTSPSPREVWGLEPYAGGATAITLYDFGVDPVALNAASTPPEQENQVHGGVRELEAAQAQLDRLFRGSGELVQTCDGPCDPE